jgi:hypothetical protein
VSLSLYVSGQLLDGSRMAAKANSVVLSRLEIVDLIAALNRVGNRLKIVVLCQ